MIKKQLKNSILIWILFIFLSSIFANYSLAANTEETNNVNINDVKTNSSTCILMDAKTGKILYSKNAYNKMYPASTTKLMTAILVLENCKLTDVATVSHNAIYSIPVRLLTCKLKRR